MNPKTDRIDVYPRVMLGKPVIRGTRIPVDLILRKSARVLPRRIFSMRIRVSRTRTDAAMRYAEGG